jgi:hypothetical protein
MYALTGFTLLAQGIIFRLFEQIRIRGFQGRLFRWRGITIHSI